MEIDKTESRSTSEVEFVGEEITLSYFIQNDFLDPAEGWIFPHINSSKSFRLVGQRLSLLQFFLTSVSLIFFLPGP